MKPRDWLIAAALVSLVALAYSFRPQNADGWVLWEKRMTLTNGNEVTAWEPLDGFGRLADCQKSGQEIVQSALEFMRSGGRKLVAVRPDGRSAVYQEGEGAAQSSVDTRHLCFPGSFDPRTSKP